MLTPILLGGLLLGGSVHVTTQKEGALRLGHYSTVDGMHGLVLDRTTGLALLRFDGQEEVHALTPRKVRDGVTELVRDDGSAMLRVEGWGAITLFLSGDDYAIVRDADAVALAGRAAPAKEAVDAKARELSEAVARETGATIAFERNGLDSSLLVAADAMTSARVALERVGSDDLGKSALKKISKVVVSAGSAPKASVSGSALQVVVVPAKGDAGRPSSASMVKVLESSL